MNEKKKIGKKGMGGGGGHLAVTHKKLQLRVPFYVLNSFFFRVHPEKGDGCVMLRSVMKL